MKLVALAIALAGSATAQDMRVDVFATPLPDTYVIGSEYLGGLPSGATAISSHWADVSVEVEGDGSFIDFFAFNPAYDTQLGPPQISNGPTASFVGNTNQFFATPDDSNPLFVAAFTYDGPLSELSFRLVGQNSAAFSTPDFPFSIVLLYQDAQGNPGPLTFESGFPGFNSITLDQIPWIPAPTSAAAFALGALVFGSARNRRK